MTPSIADQPLIEFTRALVRTPSVLGHEQAMAECTREEMERLEFDRVTTDEAGNVVGMVEGRRDGPTLLFDAHMDTVDILPREGWTRDPFGGELVDGRIFGRGSSDMKGALAAMVHGVAGLDRDALAGRAVVSGSVGEELIEGAALRHVMQAVSPDWVVIGEASELQLVRAGRGRAECVVETHGRPSHASTPDRGVNAVHLMRDVIAEVEALPMPTDPFVGRGVMCLTDVISVPYPAHSVVPSGCRATYERRLLPGETQDSLFGEMREACIRAGAEDTTVSLATTDYTTYTGLRWEEPKWYAPWETDAAHPLVQQALAGLREAALEPDPKMRSYQFCTNAAYSAGAAGVPTIGFGPSSEHHAHVCDEHLEVSQLVGAADGYRAIATALLS
ncbi:MAG: YgeY family selenium metabolism-linked hydrolase [Vicinamibacterales bacterium]|nr:YgeY family selenium metabolism-linked hydrolase [Acidobacteriota bacterium]MDP6370907.1 YgeY family selenium metabolism-linked hydrolase [Vicinamibacterales bacterium]MDP6608377.1 YgeY family selenium metabolism-linked hydrolase [Vicinamibacterales bacterium]